MTPDDTRLFTARFFTMCGFSLTVFLAAFQLFPTAPLRIRGLGGSWLDAGAFLGCLTFASAFTAPFTGALADRLGRRRMLVLASLALSVISIGYGALSRSWAILALAVVHGAFWSGLLSASAAYANAIVPPHRRAEGIGYWGLASVVAIAIAPNVGHWMFARGWWWLCAEMAVMQLLMTMIAIRLPEIRPRRESATRGQGSFIERRVLMAGLAFFLGSFGYGAITSFIVPFSTTLRIEPPGLFFTVMAVVTVLTRPLTSRWADRIGYEKVIPPCLTFIAVGVLLLTFAGTRSWIAVSAAVFALGLGSVFPIFSAYVFSRMPSERHGAAFGSILAAFDTGIGTGSIISGAIVSRFGFRVAFGVAGLVAACAAPHFLLVGRRLLGRGTQGHAL